VKTSSGLVRLGSWHIGYGTICAGTAQSTVNRRILLIASTLHRQLGFSSLPVNKSGILHQEVPSKALATDFTDYTENIALTGDVLFSSIRGKKTAAIARTRAIWVTAGGCRGTL
jgi:hypothetical protein